MTRRQRHILRMLEAGPMTYPQIRQAMPGVGGIAAVSALAALFRNDALLLTRETNDASVIYLYRISLPGREMLEHAA